MVKHKLFSSFDPQCFSTPCKKKRKGTGDKEGILRRRGSWSCFFPVSIKRGKLLSPTGQQWVCKKTEIRICDQTIQLAWRVEPGRLVSIVCWQSFIEERLDVEPIWNVEMKILSLISISDVTPSPNYWIQTNLKRKCSNVLSPFSFPPDRGLYRANNMPAPLYIHATASQGNCNDNWWFFNCVAFCKLRMKSLFLVGCGQ